MFKNYLKITLRTLLKYKSYSSINILGLAIGIAACIIIIIYVRNELSYDNYHKDANRIFRVVVDVQTGDEEIAYASTPSSLALSLKNDFPQVEQAARFMTNPELMIRYGRDKRFHESRVFHTDPEIFDIFNIPFSLGNKNACFNRPNTVVITEEIAEKYFGQQNPLGKLLNFGYAKFEVTGVVQNVPRNSHLQFDFLLSLKTFDPDNWKTEGWDNFDGQTGIFYTYIKIHQHSNLNEFGNRLATIAASYAGVIHLKKSGMKQIYSLQPIRDIHLHSHRCNEVESPGSAIDITILSAIATIILLIACLNFINLTTARSSTRVKEVAMRKVLGAFRSKLILQFLGESLMLTIFALSLALVFVEITLPWFNTLVNKELNFIQSPDFYTLFSLLAITLIVGLIAGSYPAFLMTSIRPANILHGLSDKKMQGINIRKILVIFQFAVSILLIVGTLIIYQQLRFMKHSDLGFDKDRLLVLPVPIGSLFDKNSKEFISNEFTQYHSVLSATAASFIPGKTKHLFKGGFKLIDEDEPQNYDMNILMVDENFVQTYHIDLLAGRFFDENRSTDMSNACVINEAAVKAMGYALAEKVVGKRLFDFDEREIIGVLKNFHYQSLQHIVEPLVLMINPDFYIYLTIRIDDLHLAGTIDFVKTKWNKLFPNEPFVYELFAKQYLLNRQRRLVNLSGHKLL